MPDQLIASRYRVVRELGRGGMGVVYLVEHVRTGDQLALKLLHGQGARNADVIERFKREARASARIKSENVVKVVDADVAPELEGAPFLVMELLNGTDLEKQIEREGPLPPEQALHYLGQVARALDKSHSIGIVHRDLKPENLFVHHREDGTTVLKILDFGISKIVGSDANGMTGAGMTSTGAVMGTPLYMSPEQARGRVSEIGPTTDVWAMGLIAVQLLTGEIYWRASTVPELMSQILSEPFYPPTQRWTGLPPAVDEWFARSCARDPKHRFASVGQQIEALVAALGLRAPSGKADAPSPWMPIGSGAGAGPTGPSLAGGVRTTTGAVARESKPARGRGASRAALVVGVAAIVLGGIGVTAWTLRPHAAASSPSTAAATTELAASTSPAPVSPSAAPPATTTATSMAPAGVAPDAGVAVAQDTGRATRVRSRPQPAAAPPPAPAVPPTPAPPAVIYLPAPASTPTPTSKTFNPAAP